MGIAARVLVGCPQTEASEALASFDTGTPTAISEGFRFTLTVTAVGSTGRNVDTSVGAANALLASIDADDTYDQNALTNVEILRNYAYDPRYAGETDVSGTVLADQGGPWGVAAVTIRSAHTMAAGQGPRQTRCRGAGGACDDSRRGGNRDGLSQAHVSKIKRGALGAAIANAIRAYYRTRGAEFEAVAHLGDERIKHGAWRPT